MLVMGLSGLAAVIENGVGTVCQRDPNNGGVAPQIGELVLERAGTRRRAWRGVPKAMARSEVPGSPDPLQQGRPEPLRRPLVPRSGQTGGQTDPAAVVQPGKAGGVM
jgi:hypothetical protein